MTDKQRAELTTRTSRCLHIVGFMSKRPGYESIMKDVRHAIEDASSRGNLRALRSIEADLVEWTGELSAQDRAALDAELRSALGSDVEQLRQEEVTAVKEILRRGRIRSDDEFRLVMRQIDGIPSDGSASDSIGRLNQLLSEYEANR